MLNESDLFGKEFSAYWITPGWGQFLTLLLVLTPAVLVVGLFIQAVRLASFDLIRKFWRAKEPDPETADALHYAVFANLAIFWPAAYVVHLFDDGWNTGRFLLLILFEVALIWAAMLSYENSLRGGAARKKKVAKKR
jgi:hypothetical protein